MAVVESTSNVDAVANADSEARAAAGSEDMDQQAQQKSQIRMESNGLYQGPILRPHWDPTLYLVKDLLLKLNPMAKEFVLLSLPTMHQEVEHLGSNGSKLVKEPFGGSTGSPSGGRMVFDAAIKSATFLGVFWLSDRISLKLYEWKFGEEVAEERRIFNLLFDLPYAPWNNWRRSARREEDI